MLDDSFRDIPGYECLYAISPQALIWAHSNIDHGREYGQRFLVPVQRKRDRYMVVGLSKEGVRKQHKLHRLVALTFIPNPQGLLEVNHKDSNPANCDQSNLEWVDTLGNLQHAQRVGRKRSKYTSFYGVSYHTFWSKWIAQLWVDGVKIQIGTYASDTEAAKAYN